jgi:hypothetical protein
MTFYKRLQAILEGYSISTAHQVAGGINLSNAVSAFDDGNLEYTPTDTDFDIIKVGDKANPIVRVNLPAYDNSKDKLENSKVQILHPFEVNVNYNGQLTTTIEKILSDAVECNNRTLTYNLNGKDFKAADSTDPRTIAALALMQQMQTDRKILKILRTVETNGTVNVAGFLQELKGTYFYTYRKNAGIAIAQRLKGLASSGGGSEYDRFMSMCAYALRNVTQAKPGEKPIVYDFIIKPESSSSFNDELINALKSADNNGKKINNSCTGAIVITIPKLRSSANATMTQEQQEAADKAHIDDMLYVAESELRSNILKQDRAPYAVVEYVECPECKFMYGKSRIGHNDNNKSVAYNSKSDYSENSPDLRKIGSSGTMGTTCGNPSTNLKPCTGLIDSLGKRLKQANKIDGISFQRITKEDRKKRSDGEVTTKFQTWDALANDWAATELRKLREELTRKARGSAGSAVKIAHTFGDKRRYVKLYGRAGLHSQLSVVTGKNCLLIDDNVAGGSTIELIEQIAQYYKPRRIDAFVPLKLAD